MTAYKLFLETAIPEHSHDFTPSCINSIEGGLNDDPPLGSCVLYTLPSHRHKMTSLLFNIAIPVSGRLKLPRRRGERELEDIERKTPKIYDPLLNNSHLPSFT